MTRRTSFIERPIGIWSKYNDFYLCGALRRSGKYHKAEENGETKDFVSLFAVLYGRMGGVGSKERTKASRKRAFLYERECGCRRKDIADDMRGRTEQCGSCGCGNPGKREREERRYSAFYRQCGNA